ncbi:MAG: sigma-54-dependent Fis family transcriptional regulator, partial [Proteobacteria bacterium]|nr:sigma-54-dependent Fis family transcriptional regulator [Pseudomonadota bacterium]
MTQTLKILVVDDNQSGAKALARVLEKRGDDVVAVFDGASAIEHIRTQPLDVVLTDLRMEPVDGMAVLQAAREQRPQIEVIVFTAYGAIEVAVKAMRMGARDFLTKPVTVEQVVQRLEQIRGTTSETPVTDESFVAEATSSRNLVSTLQRCAAVPTPVWIEGEIGTGRTFAALTLHRFSDPDALFTIFDITSGNWPEEGTVLLQGVGELPEDLQRGLVRQLAHAPPNVRLIATSCPGGKQQVSEGTLRAE